jgi:hypothetical protein
MAGQRSNGDGGETGPFLASVETDSGVTAGSIPDAGKRRPHGWMSTIVLFAGTFCDILKESSWVLLFQMAWLPQMRSCTSDDADKTLVLIAVVKPGRDKVIVSEIESNIAGLIKTFNIDAAAAVGGSNTIAESKKTPTAGDELMERGNPSSNEVEY